MTEELMQIDRSAIEQLVRIRKDEDVLRERISKAESEKTKVSPQVYERVSADYRKRLDALEKEARPLKEAARREYAKLKVLEATYAKSLQDVTLDKEELEFRNQLGEFADGEFEQKIAEFDRKLAEQQSRVDAAAALRDDFRSAFASEAELDAPVAATPPPRSAAPPPEPPRATEAPSETVPSARPPAASAARPKPAAPAPAPAPVADTPQEQTRTGDTVPSMTLPGTAGPEQTLPQPASSQVGATVVFTIPKLVAIMNGQPAEEYVLSARTSIGRTAKNDIQVLDDSVSRAHCEVVLATDGYRIVDLGSHNGVVVNGQKVADRLLSDGDLVDIGTRQFIFRFG
ncbi:MAG TPA: FHA domain-containing protein [Thermoanaerobaculia bacterium]